MSLSSSASRPASPVRQQRPQPQPQQQQHQQAPPTPGGAAGSSRPSSPGPAAWHFPFGPSTKYHTRERSKSSLSPSQQSPGRYYYASTAPTLVTEIRSHHHRSRSSYGAMTALTSASQSPNATPSKTATAAPAARPSTATPQQRQKHTRDPLGGRPPPQHPHHDRRTAARRRPATSSNYASFAHNLPVTPAKSPPRKRDSPFSDYFTDETRSIDTTAGPPTPTQRLLVRMAKLQSQLMRTDNRADSETIQSIERKLNEIDRQLQGGPSVPTSPHRPRRRPGLPLADSGLFMGDDDDEEGAGEEDDTRSQADSTARENDTLESDTSGSPFHDLHITPKPSTELRTPSPTKALSTTADHDDNTADDAASTTSTTSLTPSDPLHAQLRTLLAAVTTAQAELRQRCAEVRALHDRHDGDCEAQQAALELLQAENEALRTDLGFEYSELLFLKLQMKALEVEVCDAQDDMDGEDRERGRKRRNRILAEMDGWRADWADVDVSFRRRKSRYGAAVISMPREVGQGEEKEGQEQVEGEEADPVEWELRTTRTASKENDAEGRPSRVMEIVIRRVERGDEGDVEGDEEVSEAVEAVEDATNELDASHTDDEHLDLASDAAELEPELETTPRAKQQPQYVDHGIQTDDIAALLFPSDADADDDDDAAAGTDLPDEDECAVTTSSEDPPSEDEAEEISPTPRAKSSAFRVLARKAAWEELWQGLSSFAGVGEDEAE